MRKLKLKDLEVVYEESALNFEFTDEVDVSSDFFGQDRAKKAFKTGISIDHDGFNVFVSGPTGTGRRTFVLKFLEKISKNLPVPNDWVYVNNFQNPQKPVAIGVEAGVGRRFKRDMEKLVDEIISAIAKAFESEDYTKKRAEIEDEYTRMKNSLWEKLREMGKELGFSVQMTPTGVVTIPVIDGKPITPEMYEVLPDEVKKNIEENSMKMKHLVEGTIYRSRKLDKEMKEKLEEVDRQVALFAVGGLFEELKSKYRGSEEIIRFLEKVKEDVLENLNDLREPDDNDKEFYRKRYSVNLIVDNSSLEGAPVVFERNPTYSNLFGKIEYYSQMGFLKTDFTMIKPGSVHRANGGFLVIEAQNLLKNIHSWEGLKRVLMSSQIKIENLENVLGFSSTMTLDPQPVPLKLKVILVGTPFIYHLLYDIDPDFRDLFKVKVEFDWVMDRNAENTKKFVEFVESYRRSKNLLKFSKDAVKMLLWYSHRISGDREKISAKFGKIGDLMVEADRVAKTSGKDHVDREDVLKAFEDMEERVRLFQEKYDEMIEKRDLLIETEDKKVGQVNGLTILDLGDHTFGVPVKITAKTYLGKSGVIDIQRESDLSGKIHGKAVLTLEGFFSSRYSRKFPMSLTASINFEQVYSEVEGDSASLAEVLALISAIAEVPIRQDVAITGSINQNGEVQPVGGVTEKVEGFFRACKKRGLTGTQGVIIPKANVRNLVLKEEILKAIKECKFHIWAVENVDEALEITTGMKAGKMTKTGNYRKGTVNRMVLDNLKKAKELVEGEAKGRRRK